MRLASLAFLVLAGCASAHPFVEAPVATVRVHRSPPSEIVAPPARVVVQPSTARCADERGKDGELRTSFCQVTKIGEPELADLEARRGADLTVELHQGATNEDLAKLSRVPFVKTLMIESNLVTDVRVLDRIPSLVTMSIDAVGFQGLAGLQLPGVRAITVGGCGPIADLAPLGAVPNVETVQIGGSNCIDLASTAGLESLRHLVSFTSFAAIENLSGLRDAKALRWLALYNVTTSLDALDGLDVESLSLGLNLAPDNVVGSLAELGVLQRVHALDLSARRMPDLPAMPHVTNFRIGLFNVAPNVIPELDLAFVKNLPRLESLSIGGAMHADLAPAAALPALSYLDTSGVCQVDAHSLSRASKLKFLVVSELVEQASLSALKHGVDVHRANPYAVCTPKSAVR